MEPLRIHSGLAIPLERPNVDTDQMIPKQFLKRIERSGYGKFLFYDWRYVSDGKPNASFILNEPRYSGATVLIAGRNFGCGSSREHAVWALADYGFRVIIAPSFADIFANNCMKNGMATIVLSEDKIAELMRRAQETPNYQITLDLEKKVIKDATGFSASVEMDEFRRNCLINGLDDIELTLQHEAEIARFEGGRKSWMAVPHPANAS
jgi:3-isopropylmalate/(R)-2-methylmalate dehydratase small subunit